MRSDEQFRITIVEVTDAVTLHLTVKRSFPFLYKKKNGLISPGEFMISYGIDEAQRTLGILTESGAKARIEKL